MIFDKSDVPWVYDFLPNSPTLTPLFLVVPIPFLLHICERWQRRASRAPPHALDDGAAPHPRESSQAAVALLPTTTPTSSPGGAAVAAPPPGRPPGGGVPARCCDSELHGELRQPPRGKLLNSGASSQGTEMLGFFFVIFSAKVSKTYFPFFKIFPQSFLKSFSVSFST
jgi:hypothetical protein